MTEPVIERIRSGGQTGVDRAALDAAIDADVPHAGWCPSGRRAEDGPIPDHYDLEETGSSEYAERTRFNVRDADATLILCAGDPHGGTLLTLESAFEWRKPVFLSRLGGPFPHLAMASWLRANGIRELNVAGPRESSSPGVYRDAKVFMDRLVADFTYRA